MWWLQHGWPVGTVEASSAAAAWPAAGQGWRVRVVPLLHHLKFLFFFCSEAISFSAPVLQVVLILTSVSRAPGSQWHTDGVAV